MKIAVMGDAHLISPQEPDKKRKEKRKHFTETEDSFRKMMLKVKKSDVDLVVFLGDLVDFFSKENIDYAIKLVKQFNINWELVPGNHDLNNSMTKEKQIQFWENKGVNFKNRILKRENCSLIFLDSALSGVPEGTVEWLNEVIEKERKNLLFTHVPFDIPQVREFILEVAPDKNLKKYVQSKSPDLFNECLQGRVDEIYTGHLHFAGQLKVKSTAMYFLSLCIKAGNPYLDMGKAVIIDTEKDEHTYISVD